MTQATIAHDEADIRVTLAAYNAALNGGKTAAVTPLYAEDGVFMPPYSQSAVGKGAVATAYDKVFDEPQFRRGRARCPVRSIVCEVRRLVPQQKARPGTGACRAVIRVVKRTAGER
jgi:hypothetical protein